MEQKEHNMRSLEVQFLFEKSQMQRGTWRSLMERKSERKLTQQEHEVLVWTKKDIDVIMERLDEIGKSFKN
jgi:hypothetical protein